MEQGLQRVLNLAKKTGDNVIVFDSLNPDNSYVILAINKYEDLLEEAGYQDFLTEEEMTDKINRDIDPWDINDEDWNPEDIDVKDFLPKHLFGDDEPDETEDEDTEDEDVNYLYPTEDEFTSLRDESRPSSLAEESSFAEPIEDELVEDYQEPKVASVENYSVPKVTSTESYGEPKEEDLEDLAEEELAGEVEQSAPGFSSIGDLLEEKKIKGNTWEIPEERQI